jgi:TonB-dependent SusC/RagA subfamily outer membrane receptor
LKKLQLVLTNPCLKQWEDLEPAVSGHYCDRCEKHIVDLSDRSDAQLIEFFKCKKDNVCGRVLSSQLNRELVRPVPKLSWPQLLPLAIGAILVSPVQASELRPVAVQNDSTSGVSPAWAQSVRALPVGTDSIKACVKDELGNPLKGVKVRRKGFENVLAVTDSTGGFQLEILGADLEAPFTFELEGYELTESKVGSGMIIRLSARVVIMLGGISTLPLNKEPMYLVYAGKKSCTIDAERLKEISPDWIEKFEVLKDAKATALYGSRAANGVILIEIKKAYAKKIDFSQKD